VYEVLFVSKRLATTRGRAAATPHPLDGQNHPRRPDCQIATSRWSHVIPGALRALWRGYGLSPWHSPAL
jgi:hypothetical protein